MAEMNVKHELGHAVTADPGMELRGPKRQQIDETYDLATTPQPLITDEQNFWTAVAEPPDIDYRDILEDDINILKRLKLNPHGRHFTETVLRYRCVDVEVEQDLLFYYEDWLQDKLRVIEESGDDRQKMFFSALIKEVQEDMETVDRDFEVADKRLVARMNELMGLRIIERGRLWDLRQVELRRLRDEKIEMEKAKLCDKKAIEGHSEEKTMDDSSGPITVEEPQPSSRSCTNDAIDMRLSRSVYELRTYKEDLPTLTDVSSSTP